MTVHPNMIVLNCLLTPHKKKNSLFISPKGIQGINAFKTFKFKKKKSQFLHQFRESELCNLCTRGLQHMDWVQLQIHQKGEVQARYAIKWGLFHTKILVRIRARERILTKVLVCIRAYGRLWKHYSHKNFQTHKGTRKPPHTKIFIQIRAYGTWKHIAQQFFFLWIICTLHWPNLTKSSRHHLVNNTIATRLALLYIILKCCYTPVT